MRALGILFSVQSFALGRERPPDFTKIIASAKAKVFPTVVFIAPVVQQYESGKAEKRELYGSGVVVSPDGYAVTNRHVVEKALEIRVLCHDGVMVGAEVIGEDKETDLALIKLKMRPDGKPHPAATFGDSSKVRAGDFVMAMGAPWGMSRSVSFGIVSCTTRYLPGHSEYSLWLQSDASISPGSSGGPLVDTKGRVIGINTRSVLWGGDMGFAVPSETVRIIVDSLKKHGRVERSWTGLRLQPLKDFMRNVFFEGEKGVRVADVDEGSPAARAGLRSGDLLLSVAGRKLDGVHQEDLPAINGFLGGLPVGKEARVIYKRQGRALRAVLVPRKKGKVEGEDFECKEWNMTVKAINEFETPTLYFFAKEGVYVRGVRHPGNASSVGLRRGDIILGVDGQDVKGLGDLRRLYEGVVGDGKRPKKVLLEYMRGGLNRSAVLDYSTRYKD